MSEALRKQIVSFKGHIEDWDNVEVAFNKLDKTIVGELQIMDGFFREAVSKFPEFKAFFDALKPQKLAEFTWFFDKITNKV